MNEAEHKICVHNTTPVCERIDLLQDLAVRGAASPVIEVVARIVRGRAHTLADRTARRQGDWYRWLLTEEALKGTHTLPYVSDPPTEDCYRDVELTARQGGECKALNIFLVALLLRLGVPAEVVWIDQPGRPLNHVTSLIWLDGQPLWADASIRGARLGESPYEALQRTGAWHVVGGAPR